MGVRAIARNSQADARNSGVGLPCCLRDEPFFEGTPARMGATGVDSSVTSDVDDAMRPTTQNSLSSIAGRASWCNWSGDEAGGGGRRGIRGESGEQDDWAVARQVGAVGTRN